MPETVTQFQNLEHKPSPELLQLMIEPEELSENADNLELYNHAVDAALTIREGNRRIKQLRLIYNLDNENNE